MSTQPTSLIICTTARSGSNLLCDYLNNTGAIGVFAEYFNPDVVRKGTFGKRFEFGSQVSVTEYIQFLRSSYATPEGAWGAKLLYEDIEHLVVFPAMRDLLSSARLVFLRRRSKLSQAVSYYLAKTTGKWVATDKALTPLEDVEFDFAAINRHLEMLARQEALWTTLFRRFKQRPLEVIYEDLIESPEATITSILKFSGLDVKDIAIKTNLSEQRSSRNKEFCAAYLEKRWAFETPSDSVEYCQLRFGA